MALRGTTELDAVETAQADRAADIQDDYMARFEREMQSNSPPSPGRIIARAESYANSAWQVAQRISHAGHVGGIGRPPRKMRSGNPARWERRVMGHPKTEHCHDCPPLAALGWQPIGTLPAIGDSECGHLCLCHFEYSDSLEMPTMKPKKPKPEKPKTVPVTEEEHVKQIAQELYDKLKQGLKVNVVIGVGKPRG